MSMCRKKERREARLVTPGGLQRAPAEGQLTTSTPGALGYGLSTKNRSLARANSSANIYVKQRQTFGYSKGLAVREQAQECLFGTTLDWLPQEAE